MNLIVWPGGFGVLQQGFKAFAHFSLDHWRHDRLGGFEGMGNYFRFVHMIIVDQRFWFDKQTQK